MKKSQNLRFIRLFELLKRSYIASRMVDDELSRRLSKILELPAGEEQDIHATSACISATGFVDYSARFREIARLLPFISKKAKIMTDYMSATEGVTVARNYLQHINQDLSNQPELPIPTLGSISWIHEDSCHVLALDQMTDYGFASTSYDTHLKRWISQREYHIGGVVICFHTTLDAMKTFLESIIEGLEPDSKELKSISSGSTRLIKIGALKY
jgi:hypothetical protein